MDQRETVVCLLPGEVFSGVWVSHWTSLLCHLMGRFNVQVLFSYCSTVHITRASLVDAFQRMEREGLKIDYALWLDDDNVLTPSQFDLLYQDLQEVKEISGVVGWTWCQPNELQIKPLISCGMLEGTEASSFDPLEFLDPLKGDVWGIEYSGFPCALIRWGVHSRLGQKAFRPRLTETNYWGIVGEDVSFYLSAKEEGFKFAVDRRVKVPHLKLRSADFSMEQLQECDKRSKEEQKVGKEELVTIS